MTSRTSTPSVFRKLRTRRAPFALVSMLAAATALSAGCAYGPEGETDTVVQELNANSRTAYDFFISKGLTPVQAAGVVGNLIQESNVNPMAVQPGGPGRGIAQWSVGGRWDHDSGDNAVWYAGTQSQSVWSLDLQLKFVWYELNHFSWLGLSQLRAATTISAATIAFETRYEGCGQCLESQRISYAQQVYNAYHAAPAWGAQFVSQSFPYAANGSVSIHAGGTASVSITLKNIGTHAWDSHTCIATTGPRDRNSVFAGSEWRAANRPSCLAAGATVAAGANHTFTWTMHAPAMTGRYDEHWGVVEDGTTWFSASGQAGPPDDQLEGLFTVTAPVAQPDAGTPDAGSRDAGSTDSGDPADSGDDASTDPDASTDDASTDTDASADDASADNDASTDNDGSLGDGGDGGDGGTGMLAGGCSTQGARGSSRANIAWVFGAAIAIAGVRRRRHG